MGRTDNACPPCPAGDGWSPAAEQGRPVSNGPHDRGDCPTVRRWGVEKACGKGLLTANCLPVMMAGKCPPADIQVRRARCFFGKRFIIWEGTL